MLRVATHREAAAETIAAALYYDRQLPGLGADFLVRYDSIVTSIRLRPRRFQSLRRGVRKARMTRFPYAIYFEVFPDRLHILAVAHQHRRPFYWVERRTDLEVSELPPDEQRRERARTKSRPASGPS